MPSERDYDAEMKLPDGKTCRDCRSYSSCLALFSCPPTNTSCDWHPSKFRERPDSVLAARKEGGK